MSLRKFDEFFKAEQEARRLTRRYVVVECRDEADADTPGVEATFVVIREDQVHTVPNRREVVFVAEIAQPAAHRYRLAIDNALLRLRAAAGTGPTTGPALRETLESIHDSLSADLAAS